MTATWWAAAVVDVPAARRAAAAGPHRGFRESRPGGRLRRRAGTGLSISMEGAPFITAFPRREAAGLVRDLKLGDKLNETTGRLVANREGIPVILAGSIDREGSGYRIAVRAVDPAKPEPPLAVENHAPRTRGKFSPRSARSPNGYARRSATRHRLRSSRRRRLPPHRSRPFAVHDRPGSLGGSEGRRGGRALQAGARAR